MDHLTPHPDLYNVPFKTDDFNGMPYRFLGSSGLKVPAVGLGTWKIGYPETGDGARVDEKTAFAIFDRAIELGAVLWDTANRYTGASGNSERIIGKWFKANPDMRRNVVLATKAFGSMDGRTPNHSRLSRGNIIDSVYASLARLQLDYIDILYFHKYDPHTPIEESLVAVEDLVQRDLVRYFAVSNFSVEQLKLYREVENQLSCRSRILAVQNRFDIISGEQAGLRGVLDFCAASGISFVAWSPLARGLLTGRYLLPDKAGKGDRLFDEGTLEKDTVRAVMTKVKKLAKLSDSWGIPLSQLTLAYMLTLPGMGPVIPSSSTVEQIEMNAGAGRIHLDMQQIEKIRKVVNPG